jgi:chromosome segregation ATPase
VSGQKRPREATEQEEKREGFNYKRILTELKSLRGEVEVIKTDMEELKAQLNGITQQIEALPGVRPNLFRPVPLRSQAIQVSAPAARLQRSLSF